MDQASPTRPCSRPLTGLDALILLAGTLGGIAGLRPHMWFVNLRSSWLSPDEPLRETILTLLRSSSPLLLGWTIAWALIRLAPPRPPLRRLARQPGSVACGVALLVGGVEVIMQWLTLLNADLMSSLVSDGAARLSAEIAPAVLGAWATLRLGGCWRAERGWVDRAGRALGWSWLGSQTLYLITNATRFN